MIARVEASRVRFVEVTPGLSDGRLLQILSGIRIADAVALNPPVELNDGDAVQPVEKPATPDEAPSFR